MNATNLIPKIVLVVVDGGPPHQRSGKATIRVRQLGRPA